MNATKAQLPALVEEELRCAKENHEDFHSLHEGYAVMLEEIEECQDELRAIQQHTSDLWCSVKDDSVDNAAVEITKIELAAVNLAAEAIQVAAMARKAMLLVDKLQENG